MYVYMDGWAAGQDRGGVEGFDAGREAGEVGRGGGDLKLTMAVAFAGSSDPVGSK